MTASVLYPSQCFLGEGPLWHPERKSCFWVDIENRRFFEYNWLTQQTRSRTLDYRISLVVQDQNNHLVLGLEGGIARYNLDTESLSWMMDIEKQMDMHRCNDGKVDSRGRLWLGTMHRNFDEGAGSLYCIDENILLKKKQDNITISNGLAWSRDNRRLYFIDSPTRKVQSFLYDETTGHIIFERDVIHIPESMGAPDGMAIDTEDRLWIAHWGGFGVYCWDTRTGNLKDKIEVPAPHVTSCAFVGENLDHLLITTAQQDMTEADLKKFPHSGDTFIARMPVTGTLPHKCAF